MHRHGSVAVVHNMVVVGERRIFLSHLPMFMAPHSVQLILEATFVKEGKSIDEVYFADRASWLPLALEALFWRVTGTIVETDLAQVKSPIDRALETVVPVTVRNTSFRAFYHFDAILRKQ